MRLGYLPGVHGCGCCKIRAFSQETIVGVRSSGSPLAGFSLLVLKISLLLGVSAEAPNAQDEANSLEKVFHI